MSDQRGVKLSQATCGSSLNPLNLFQAPKIPRMRNCFLPPHSFNHLTTLTLSMRNCLHIPFPKTFKSLCSPEITDEKLAITFPFISHLSSGNQFSQSSLIKSTLSQELATHPLYHRNSQIRTEKFTQLLPVLYLSANLSPYLCKISYCIFAKPLIITLQNLCKTSYRTSAIPPVILQSIFQKFPPTAKYLSQIWTVICSDFGKSISHMRVNYSFLVSYLF